MSLALKAWAVLAVCAPLGAQTALAHEILKQLIEINTTDSSGDNTRAAEEMAARLRSAGFPAEDVQVLGPVPRKGNLVARFRGAGQNKPILFLGHLDVVEARRADWTLDPFQLTEKDGFFYGRGTQDMKSDDALMVTTFIALKQQGFRPERDLILALTSDEEGGDHNGVDWLLQNHRQLIDAAFCMNADSGGGQLRNGRRVLYAVEGAEKTFMSFRFTATDKGGHSSLPRLGNPIGKVAGALNRLANYEFPVHLNPVTQAFFERMSRIESGELAESFTAVSKTPPDEAAATRLSADPYYHALLHTTCVPTEITGGHAENALPQKAEAIVNCRMLPNETAAATQAKLQELAADGVAVEPLRPPKNNPGAVLDPAVLHILQRTVASFWPELPLVPVMDTGASDGIILESAGIPVYGMSALSLDTGDVRAHGQDERISIPAFDQGLEFETRLVRALAATGK